MGHPVMGQFMADGADDGAVLVAKLAGADAGHAAHGGLPPISTDDQACPHLPPVAQGGEVARPLEIDRGHTHGRDMGDEGQFLEPADETLAHGAVLDDPAKGRLPALGARNGPGNGLGLQIGKMIMDEEGARFPELPAAVGNADVADRLGRGGQIVPGADAREHLLRAIGDGRGTAVEPGFGHVGQLFRLDQQSLDPGTAQSRRHGHADHAATDDQHLGFEHMCLRILG